MIVSLAVGGIIYYFMRGRGQSNGEVTTASGLKIIDLVVGTGASPVPGKTLKVDYTGTLENGMKFDSSHDPGKKPIEFVLGKPGIIQGWQEGIATMKVGGKRKLIIPPALAYGAAGRPPSIPLKLDTCV